MGFGALARAPRLLRIAPGSVRRAATTSASPTPASRRPAASFAHRNARPRRTAPTSRTPTVARRRPWKKWRSWSARTWATAAEDGTENRVYFKVDTADTDRVVVTSNGARPTKGTTHGNQQGKRAVGWRTEGRQRHHEARACSRGAV